MTTACAAIARIGAPTSPQAVLRPVRGHHAFEACVEQLATAIRLGVYPARHDAAARARPGRAARTSPGRRCARRWRRCARPDWSRPPAGPRWRHGGDPQAAYAVRRGPPPGSRRARRQDWLDALDFRRIVEPGAASLAAPRRPRRRRPRPARGGARRGGRRPQAGRAPAGRLPLPPDRRRAHRLAPDGRGGHLGAVHPARDAARDPGARGQHRPLRPPARRAGARDPGRQARPGPHGSWRSTATTRPRCCAAWWD